MGPIHLIMEQF